MKSMYPRNPSVLYNLLKQVVHHNGFYKCADVFLGKMVWLSGKKKKNWILTEKIFFPSMMSSILSFQLIRHPVACVCTMWTHMLFTCISGSGAEHIRGVLAGDNMVNGKLWPPPEHVKFEYATYCSWCKRTENQILWMTLISDNVQP